MKKFSLSLIVSLLLCIMLVSAFGFSMTQATKQFTDRSGNVQESAPKGTYIVKGAFFEGWNLAINFGNFADFNIIQSDPEVNEIKKSNILAVYYYSPIQGKYLEVYPNKDASFDSEDWEHRTNAAYWVYSNKEGIITYETDDVKDVEDGIKLFSGWNILGVTPGMGDVNIEDLVGSCNIEKVYFYSSYDVKWFKIDNLGNDFEGNMVGSGALLKVSDDCVFGTESFGSGTVTPPPSIPN